MGNALSSISSQKFLKICNYLYGDPFEQEPFKSFIEELFERLDFSKFPPSISAVFPILIPEYIRLKLPSTFTTAGEMIAFKEKVERLILRGRDQSLDRMTREEALRDALVEIIIKIIGPHAIKQFQLFGSKERSDWVMAAINKARSNLPAVSEEEVKNQLIENLKEKGEINLAKNFDNYFRIEGTRAGSVGTIVLADYNPNYPHSENWIRAVLKIPKRGIKEAILKDNEFISEVFESLVVKGLVTAQQAAAFKEFNKEVVKNELLEVEPWHENESLEKSAPSYDGRKVIAVRRLRGPVLDELTDKLIGMELAPGVNFGGRLGQLRYQLRTTKDPIARDKILAEVSALRKSYVEFAQKNTANVLSNLPVHSDPHTGNFNWLYNPAAQEGATLQNYAENLAYVYDFGATIDPAHDPAEHLQLKRFLFHLNLSAGTGDSYYLKTLYQNYYLKSKDPKKVVPQDKVNELFQKVQIVLDATKNDPNNRYSVSVDVALRNIVDVLAKETIENSHAFQNFEKEILPKALLDLGRTNTLVAEGLGELSAVLKGSKYEFNIPFLDRTQLGIAIKTSLLGKHEWYELLSFFGMIELFQRLWTLTPWAEDFWTPEAWEYFKKNNMSLSQLNYERKFLFGILGIKKEVGLVTAKPVYNSYAERIFAEFAGFLSTSQAMNLYGSVISNGQMRDFSQKFKENVDLSLFPKAVSKVFPEILADYLLERLRISFRSGKDWFDYERKLQASISKGNDPLLSIEERNLARKEIIEQFISVSGPHAIHQFQLLRTEKLLPEDEWIKEGLKAANSLFPPVLIDDAKILLIEEMREKGNHWFADHFDELIQFEEIPSAGFTGDIVFARYRENKEDDKNWKRIVIKIPRKLAKEDLEKDGKLFNQIFQRWADKEKITKHEAETLSRLNDYLINAELQEFHPFTENMNIETYAQYFHGRNIGTIQRVQSSVFELLKDSFIFLERAPGERFGDRRDLLRAKLKQTKDQKKRDEILQELAAMRKAYAEFARKNTKMVLDCNRTHGNPHSSSFHWKYNHDTRTGILYVLNYGALVQPSATEEEHKQLKQFLFHLALSASTGDAHFLRIYYQTQGLSNDDADELVSQAQSFLDEQKKKIQNEEKLNVDEMVQRLIDVAVAAASHKPSAASLRLLPEALARLARTNLLVAAELDNFNEDLKHSEFERLVPYLDRSQMGMAFRGAVLPYDGIRFYLSFIGLKDLFGRGKALTPLEKDYWSEEAWEYFKFFVKARLGMEQISYSRKFAYGIMGLSDMEATQFDVGLSVALAIVGTVVGVSAAKIGGAALRRVGVLPPKVKPIRGKPLQTVPRIGNVLLQQIMKLRPRTPVQFAFGITGVAGAGVYFWKRVDQSAHN